MELARVNLALAGLVALLALVALFGPDPERESAPEPLTGLEPAALRHLRIDRGANGALAFRRDAGGWRMSEPYRIAANRDRLRALARIASTPSHRSFPAGQADLTELGLAPTPLLLELGGLTLEIGGIEPIRRLRYVRLAGRVHLIEDLFQHHLLASAEAFVDPRPFPGTIRSASLDGRPLSASALDRLSRLRAEKVENGHAAPDNRRLEVRMEKMPTPLHFSLGGDGRRLWRDHPPILYRLTPPLTPVLLQE